jgi:hypothetical protein
MSVEEFIAKWLEVGGTERANAASFIIDLCQILEVPAPDRNYGDEARDNYVFERHVRKLDLDGDTTANFIDCYKRGCFVLEAKQSNKRQTIPAIARSVGTLFVDEPFQKAPVDRPVWDRLMKNARAQALRYAQNLPPDHDWPPFLIIMDVGHVIELYADFTGMGRGYQPFPDERSHRIGLQALADPAIRARLKSVWTNPRSLDPAIKRAEVTRDVASRLATVAQTLEKRHDSKIVAEFLMRCLFTGFAEDVRLLPEDCFLNILEKAKKFPQHLPDYLNPLWQAMENGRGFLKEVEAPVRYFNGGLFRNAHALPLTADELSELIVAVRKDWTNVEPAIFGTLLEKALSEAERARYGAEFTPRAYVERLVIPTVVEPLEEEWGATQAAAEVARGRGDSAGAVKEIKSFHRRLCETRVLDPACGTGNFLYVTLERLKRLETRVLQTLEELGVSRQQDLDLAGHTVGPAQLLGVEKNGRAVHIAELVLWIGHLQLQLRHTPVESLGEPILQPIRSVREGDAVLLTGKERIVLENGRPRTRWDGRTTRIDPLTGRKVPDDSPAAQVEVVEYPAAREAEWPQADFIVGNPPFIAGKDLRQELGDGYAEALWRVYPDIPGGADFVMYWWHKAAELVRDGKARRFGFITTNSITQTFSRRVIQRQQQGKPPLHLAFAIADHPWSDGSEMAAVRIAMTVGTTDNRPGVLKTVTAEGGRAEGGGVEVELEAVEGRIGADLTAGPDVAGAAELKANDKLSCPGVKLHGAGFIVSPAEARGLGLGIVPGLEAHIRPYLNGRDFTGRSRRRMVIDLFGQTEAEVRQRFPTIYQHVYDRVKPERDHNNRTSYRTNWWVFGEPRREFRPALANLPRYIATVETAKHRVFQFLDKSILPDNKLVAIAIADGWALGVLSSRIHLIWSLAAGGWLGYGNDPVYVKSRCFDTFPFPELSDRQRRDIGVLADELDAHRRRVLDAHPNDLTLTELYNMLEKRRARAALTPGEQLIDRLGSVAVIQDLHDRIDRAVAAAYGWPADLSDTAILERLVALNAERRREETEEGLIRWLRPKYQNPDGREGTGQIAVDLVQTTAATAEPWPKTVRDQMLAIQTLLRRSGTSMSTDEIVGSFKKARSTAVRATLAGLVALGNIRAVNGDRFAA